MMLMKNNKIVTKAKDNQSYFVLDLVHISKT